MQGEAKLMDVVHGRVVADRVGRAVSLWERSVGLLGRRALEAGEGLWIEPCSGVHTMGMRFPVDLLFLDRDGRCVRSVDCLRPWRFCGPVRGAHAVVELRCGALADANTTSGSVYRLTPGPDAAPPRRKR